MNAPPRRSKFELLRRMIAASLMVLSTLSVVATAQEKLAEPSPGAAPLRYRRVFVPSERTADWPTGGAQYLPIKRTEFERLVNELEEQRQLSRAGNAQLASARYAARLTDGGYLSGAAQFDVRLVEPVPSVLSLQPWNAVLLSGNWLAPSTSADEAPATLGVWSSVGEASTYGLLADRSGTVRVQWQLASERSGPDLEFVLSLPNAASQQLVLDLPADATPAISSGQLLRQSPSPKGERQWTFQLAGGVEHRLAIRRPVAGSATDQSASVPLAAMTEAYHVTVDGVDYEAELRLQRRGASPTELRLQAPASLHVATVTVNRQPAGWRRDPEDASGLLVLLPLAGELPPGAPLVVAINGAAAAVLDAPWTLPSLSPQGVFWTEGTSTIWSDPALELRSIAPQDCSVLNVVGVGSGVAGEVFRLQAWNQSATAQLVVGDRLPSLQHRRGVAAEFADREVVARARVSLWTSGGRTFHLTAPIGDEWSIDSVASDGADELVEWHMEEGAARKLHLQLRRSPTEASPLQLTITGRRPWRAWTRMASLSDLDFVKLPGRPRAAWLSARDRRDNEVVPDAKLFEAVVVADRLPTAAAELLGGTAEGLVVDLSKAAPNSLVSVASTATTYSGEGWMDLTAGPGGYEHRVEIACRPLSGSVADLRVLAARSLPVDGAWSLADGTPLVMERTAPGASARGPVEYRVRLPQPFAAPFRIRGFWRSAAPADAAINFTSLPDATAWQAWAIFRADSHRLAADAGAALPAVTIPAASFAEERRLPAIGCYRLGDDPTSPPAPLPSFVAHPSGSAGAEAGAVAWSCDAETQQFANGTQHYRVVYQLEARYPVDVQLRAPRGAAFTSFLLDNRPVAVASAESNRTVSLRIPGSPRVQRLEASYEREIGPLERRATVGPAFPRTSFPVLQGAWRLHWPAAYNSTKLSSISPAASSQSAEMDWIARLGGPLSGHNGHRWYDGMLLAHVDAASPVIPALAADASTTGGWTTLTQPFVDRPAPVELRLASGEQAAWHVAWLVATVAAAWLWARTRRGALCLIAAVAAVCLIVPEPLVPLPQAMFLGLVTGVLVRQFVSYLTKPRRTPLGNGATAAAALAFATLVAGASHVRAQGVDAPDLPAATIGAIETAEKVPEQVLFPVDDEGNAVGSDVYVPAALAAKLLPAASGGPSAALVDARYQVELQPAPVGGQIVPQRIRLTFRWESRRPQARVELPLVAADGVIDPRALLLNGEPIPVQWNGAGTALLVSLPRPGSHELEVNVLPSLGMSPASVGQRARLQHHIPSLPGARVEILHPADLAGVTAANAVPAAGQSSAARTLFRLGATPLLDVSWPSGLEREAEGVAVEQLSWLEIDPAGARLEVRLRLTGNAAALRLLRLAVSPQLKLLPLAETSPLELVSDGVSEGAATDVLSFRFRTPPALPTTLTLQFQLQRTLSVGRIDYPGVTVLGLNVRSRHVAVSADPRLRLRDVAVAGVTPATPAEIEPIWGPAVADAALHFTASTATPRWTLEVSPVPPRFVAREQMELFCREDEVGLEYGVNVDGIEGELLVHRLVVSPDLKVESAAVQLEGDGEAVPVRWSRPQPDRVDVFLSRPLGEPHVLRVKGRLNDAITAAIPAGAAADAGVQPAVERLVQGPRIGLESTQATPIDLLLFRTSDVLVDWSATPPATRPAATPPDPAKGQLVGQFTLRRGEARLPELKISPNVAQYDADLLLTLQLASAEAVAECRVEGKVTQGVVDRLQLIVGKNWRGPFIAEPSAQITSRDVADDAERRLLDVRLAKPVAAGEPLKLALRGAVTLEADQRIRFPTLRLANAQRQRTFLMLPATAGNLTAEWMLRGLRSEPLPKALAAAAGLSRSASAYRAERERFIAEQRVFPDAMQNAAVRLAESRVVVDAEGNAVALTQLIVQPGGGEDCFVTFPAGAQLQYAAVDGVPQSTLPAADEPWRAPVGPRFLPRVFLFHYRLPKLSMGASHTFAQPQTTIDGEPLSPQLSLWQIDDPAALARPANGASVVSASEFAAAARRAQIDALLDALPLASQLAEWELQIWRQPWLDRLCHGAAGSAAADPPAWTRLLARLDPQLTTDRDPPLDPIARWEETVDADGSAATFRGDADGAVELPRRASSWPLGRWFAALALASAIGLAWRLPAAFRSLTLPMRRWPYVVLVTAGFAWWYYLSPSFFGVIVMAFAAAAYVKSRQ